MKKLIVFILSFSLLHAGFFSSSKKQQLSDIKPAKIEYLEPIGIKCNDFCLNDFLSSGLYLSFLANYNHKSNEIFDKIYSKLSNSILDNIYVKNDRKTKIALIIPHKVVKSISTQVINSSLSYLIRRGDDISFKVFLTGTDSKQDMQKAIDEIKNDDYFIVISPNTKNGAKILSMELTNQVLYFPNLNKEDTDILEQHVKFGGLNYDAQLDALLSLNPNKFAIITDKDMLFQRLNAKISEKTNQNIYTITKDVEKNPKSFLNKNSNLAYAGIFLNLKVVDVSLFASQIRAYEVNPSMLFATQVAFNPALLRISQSEDLTKLYIANSLESLDDELNYINEFLGVNLNYNWIAYSTSAGLDSLYTSSFDNTKRYFENNFVDNTLSYPVYIYKVRNKSFYKFK